MLFNYSFSRQFANYTVFKKNYFAAANDIMVKGFCRKAFFKVRYLEKYNLGINTRCCIGTSKDTLQTIPRPYL